MLMGILTPLLQGNTGKSDPLPVMPPSPPSFLEGLTAEKVITLLPLVKEFLGSGDKKDDTKELLLMMLKQKDTERLSPKDTIELMNSMRPAASGTDDFRKALENLSLITQVAQNLRPQEQQGATFMDAIGAFLTNSDFVSSIGTSIRKRAETAAMTAEVKARKDLSDQALRMGYRAPQNLPAQGTPNQQVPTQQQPQQVQQQPVQQQAVQPNGHANGAVAPAPVQPARVSFPPLPEKIGDHLQEILTAKDSADSVEKTFGMMMYLAGFNEWRGFVTQLLTAAKNADKKACLTMFGALCSHLVRIRVLDMEQAKKIFSPVEDHFDDIVAHVNGQAPAEVPDPSVDPFGAALHQAENPDEYEEDDEEGDDEEEDDGEEGDEEGDDDEEDVEDETEEEAVAPRALRNSN